MTAKGMEGFLKVIELFCISVVVMSQNCTLKRVTIAECKYMQSTSCEMLGWIKHKVESRLPGEISITSDMQMTPPLRQKVKRNSKAS